jgi:thiol-disulfide isomerase/thioredoxin
MEAYYYGLMYYLSNNYWDSTGKPVIHDPNRLRILDSIPWTLSPLSHSPQLYALANLWPYLSWQQWYHAGIGTVGEKRFIKTFEFAHRLPPPARDVAELIAFREATYSATPTELFPYIEKELKTYRGLASDTAYLGEFNRKFAALSARLPGKPAPPFSLPDTVGMTHTLAEFRGKIIYLDFWGTWCGPCIGELPDLLKLEKSFVDDTNVVFVSIALQSTEFADQSPAGWRKFISARGLRGIQLYADRQFENLAAKAYSIYAVPTFMLINRDGTFFDAAAPRPTSGKAEAAIRATLSGKGD